MSEEPNVAGAPANPTGSRARTGMSAATARTIEWSIITLCLASLVFVFQPVSPALHALGMVLVVVGALAFNLVPLCRPGRPVMGLVRITAIIAVILVVAIGIAIGTAVLYGDYVRVDRVPERETGLAQLGTQAQVRGVSLAHLRAARTGREARHRRVVRHRQVVRPPRDPSTPVESAIPRPAADHARRREIARCTGPKRRREKP